MKCSCCDKDMSDKELTWNEELNAWELCTVCLDVAYDAAFSQGFAYDEEDWSFVVTEGFDDTQSYVYAESKEPVLYD